MIILCANGVLMFLSYILHIRLSNCDLCTCATIPCISLLVASVSQSFRRLPILLPSCSTLGVFPTLLPSSPLLSPPSSHPAGGRESLRSSGLGHSCEEQCCLSLCFLSFFTSGSWWWVRGRPAGHVALCCFVLGSARLLDFGPGYTLEYIRVREADWPRCCPRADELGSFCVATDGLLSQTTSNY